MKNVTRVFVFVWIICASVDVNARSPFVAKQQVKITEAIKRLYNDQLYQDIIDTYAPQSATLSPQALKYVAKAYLEYDEYSHAERFVNLVLDKNPKDADAIHTKGLIFSKKGDVDAAKGLFEQAISLSPQNGDYIASLGDVYYARDEFSQALIHYIKAGGLKRNPSVRAQYMVGLIYADQGDYDKALMELNAVKSKVLKTDGELYESILQNIGYIYFVRGDYNNAIPAYRELVAFSPSDYHSYEKLIQCNYGSSNFVDGDYYRNLLSEIRGKGYLEGTELNEKVCIDNFKIENQIIYVFDLHRSGECKDEYTKYVILVQDEKGEIISELRYQYQPDKSGFEFFQKKGDKIFTYNLLFEPSVSYSKLRGSIVDILSGLVNSSSEGVKKGWKIKD